MITVSIIIAKFQTEHICVRGAPLLIKVYKVNLVALKSILPWYCDYATYVCLAIGGLTIQIWEATWGCTLNIFGENNQNGINPVKEQKCSAVKDYK